MKRVLVIGLALCVLAGGPAFSDDAATLLKKAEALKGKMLTAQELRSLLIGNTGFFNRQTRLSWIGRYNYFADSTKMLMSDERQGEKESTWGVKSDGRFCSVGNSGDEFCRNNVRVEIKEGKIILKMTRLSGRKKGLPMEYTLFPGKMSY